MTSQNSLGQRSRGWLLRGRLEQPPLGSERAWEHWLLYVEEQKPRLESGKQGTRALPCVSAV